MKYKSTFIVTAWFNLELEKTYKLIMAKIYSVCCMPWEIETKRWDQEVATKAWQQLIHSLPDLSILRRSAGTESGMCNSTISRPGFIGAYILCHLHKQANEKRSFLHDLCQSLCLSIHLYIWPAHTDHHVLASLKEATCFPSNTCTI